MYQGSPEKIRRYMEDIFQRIRQWMDADSRSKISEQAYLCTDTRVLTEPPNDKIVLLTVAFIFMVLCALAIYYGLYLKASGDLKECINLILRQAAGKP
jgi:hypothetical protein